MNSPSTLQNNVPWQPLIERVLQQQFQQSLGYPLTLFQMLRPISPIAWIPLAILWFGVGFTAVALVAHMLVWIWRPWL